VLPVDHIAPLPKKASMEQGACLGIPGMTAHRAVNVAGPIGGRTVMVQGAAGAVGLCAVALARRAGARVIGSVRSASDKPTGLNSGAHEVVLSDSELIACVRTVAPEGVDHIVEVAFGANIQADVELLKQGDPSRAMPRIMPLRRSRSGKWCSKTFVCSFWAATISQRKQKPTRRGT